MGLAQVTAAPALILFQAFGFERAVRRAGLLRLEWGSLAAFSVLLAVAPAQSWALGAPPAAQWAVTFGHFWLTTIARVTAFTALFILVANSALPEDRAKVNGLGQAAVSLVRAAGPPLFTPLFAWSVGDSSPENYAFTWLLMAGMAAGAAAYARTLPAWLERKRVRGDA